MVRNLLKPEATLQEHSADWKWGLNHAVVGLAGELLELYDPEDTENMLEETGDVLFYNKALRFSILDLLPYDSGGPFLNQSLQVSDSVDWVSAPNYIQLAGFLLDMYKKVVIFDQKLSGFRERFNAVANTVDWMVEIRLRTVAGMTREDALNHNLEKLLTGPKARYAQGYSDQAAALRVDKLK